jgi:hypothetical protein
MRSKIIRSVRITLGVVTAVCVLWGGLFVYMGAFRRRQMRSPSPSASSSYSESLSDGGSVLGAMLSLSGSRYIASLRNAIVWLTTTTNVTMAGSVSDPVMGFRP